MNSYKYNIPTSFDTSIVIYKIPAPYSRSAIIEVYGDIEIGYYEWRVVDKEIVLRSSMNIGYEIPELALRDALVFSVDEFFR